MTQASEAKHSTNSQLKSPLVIVDGSSYLFRAFHALPPLTTSQGQPTGAIKGVMSMLQKLITEYNPDYLCVVFDTPGTNFRHDIFPEYKANRGAAPEDLISQIKPLHELIQAMGIPLLAMPGVEADDVIATLAEKYQTNFDIVISSGDKDLAQLVNSRINLVNTMKQEYLDETGVFTKFGVTAGQIVDYLSLVGDKVDNIPGIDKVGPKTAVKWLQEYESIDNLLEHQAQIKGKIGENLREQANRLTLARQLVTLQRDVPLPLELEDLQLKSPDQNTLFELLTTFEFSNELKKLSVEMAAGQIHEGPADKPNCKYRTLTTENEVSNWLKAARSADWIAFDTETNGLDVHQSKLVGVSLAYSGDEAVYIPCDHQGDDIQQVSPEFLIEQIRPLLEAKSPLKVGQNIKFDMNLLKQYGIHMQAIGGDTMLESYAIDPTAGRHDMNSLAQRFLGRSTIQFKEIAGQGAKQKTFDQIELHVASQYAAEDADITWHLHETLIAQLAKQESQFQVYRDIELPLMPILAQMEYHGTLVNADELNAQSKVLSKRIAELEARAHDIVGEPFNLASPKQIGLILYEKMGIPVIQKTPKGAPSTAESVLQELATEHQLPRLLLEHRSLSKLKSTYTDKLPELINPKTGRIHTSYHQATTSTGRLSSSDPNLQNIPIKTEEGRLIRRAFTAPAGFKIVSADYSQVELRLMAHFSKDARLTSAFANNVDIHAATASEIFDVSLDAIQPEHRRAAKAINFGLIYGMSAFGLSQQLHIPRQQAQEYIDSYFSRYPNVLTYMETCKVKARDQGYVETLFGRRLNLPDIHSKNHAIRQGAERLAINAPLQGTAADIIKISMIRLDEWLKSANLKSQMIMQVHDEIVLEVHQSELTLVQKEVSRIMSGAANLSVPLLVSIGSGDHWLEAH